MPVLYISYAPLIEVTSTFLNAQQQAVWTQRGNGANNTLVATIDTPDPAIKQKTVAIAMDSFNYAPPLFGGIVDTSINWRDRHLSYELDFDPDRDIRWGEVDDNKQPLESMSGTFYTRTGGINLDVDPKGLVGIYVDSTNGYLWIKKAPGFLRGTIRCTCQLKERS